VYRHFGTRDDLLGSLVDYVAQKLLRPKRWPPTDLDALRDFLITQAAGYAEAEPALRAAATTEAGRKARQDTLPGRKQQIAEGLEPFLDDVSEEDKRRVREVYMLLTSSSGYRTARDFFAYSEEELADTIVWVVERLAQGSRAAKRKGKEKP
jgi:AcrR family transcriptional regulator